MKKILGVFLLVLLLTGCRIFNSSIMLKTPKDFNFAEMNDSTSRLEYKISPNDVIQFRLYSNDGFKLVDVTSMALSDPSAVSRTMGFDYLVDQSGRVKLPVLGFTKITGITIRDAEKMLEELYGVYYNKPFVILKVVNKRVMVFPGMGGAGRVIPIDNNNITLIEGLALAGGISQDGKAHKIKLIRRNAAKPLVYHIDLSTIDGLAQANIILQANDIIYVEPRLKISQGIVNEITPVLTLFTTVLLFYTVFK